MMLKLASPVTDLSGIGPAKAKALRKLGVSYVRDLLYSFPRRYEDFSQVTPIAQLEAGKQLTVLGRVKSVKSAYGFRGRRRLLRIFVEIEDDTGVLQVTWYNLRFLEKQLWIGREVYVAGTIEAYRGPKTYPTSPEASQGKRFAVRSPAMEFTNHGGERIHTASITPVYSETQGVTSRFLRYQVKHALPLVSSLPEYMPADIIERNTLMDIHEALRAVHFPQSPEQLESAQQRLRFDELFFLQLAALVRRRRWQKAQGMPIPAAPENVKEAVAHLPFALTGAQQEGIQEITSELALPHPMNRLLQGDVGSGKSAVAQVAIRLVLQEGLSVLYLAPTEILARQQAAVLQEYLSPTPVKLLIGALTSTEKKNLKEQLREGKTPFCLVGTHALLQEDVEGRNIGLVIIDEQHRFGVAQRQALRDIQEEWTPHLLSMTATPIPRTLNLTVYGDLDVSILDELPPGRKEIKTEIVPPQKRDDAVIHTLAELHRGRQAYVIAPLIEDSKVLEAKSAKKAYEEIQKLFPGIAVSLLHGQMKSEEKEAVMRNFAAGAIQLLVTTAVVEVGVNVPNATVMIIEGAERFGLAQLHQFRGRIGRGEHQSYCYLFPTTIENATSERLRVLVSTTDGFKIAEEDLRLRGPGEIYGLVQSGFSDLKVASLLDYPTIKLARTEATKILKEDPELEKYPILRGKVEQKNLRTHFE